MKYIFAGCKKSEQNKTETIMKLMQKIREKLIYKIKNLLLSGSRNTPNALSTITAKCKSKIQKQKTKQKKQNLRNDG